MRTLALLLFVALAGRVSAGSWDIVLLGPGVEPGSQLVELLVEANSLGDCTPPSPTWCEWVEGGHYLQISPAPLAVLGPSVTPNENGARLSFYTYCADCAPNIFLELDPNVVYTLSEGVTSNLWGYPDPDDTPCYWRNLCEAVDDDFPEMKILGGAVSSPTTSISALKAQY